MATQRERWEFVHWFMKHAPLGEGETEGDLQRKALRLLRYAATHQRIETNLTNAAYRKHSAGCLIRMGGKCNCTMVEDGEATRKAIAKRDRMDARMEAIAKIEYGALTVKVKLGKEERYIP